MSHRIAVIYHSRRGTVRTLAKLAAEGARETGAKVLLLRVEDDGPGRPQWPERAAEPEDVVWADGLVLAGPTYYGNVSSPLKRFLESTSLLWGRGLLADRVATGITCSTQRHGGREATLTALHHTLYHWGCWVAGSDPDDPVTRAAGGTPYGLVADNSQGAPAPHECAAARALGRRLAGLAARARPLPPLPPLPPPSPPPALDPQPRSVLPTPAAVPVPAVPVPTGSANSGAPGGSGYGPPPAALTVTEPAPAPQPASAAPPAPVPAGTVRGAGLPGVSPRPVRFAVVYHGEDAAIRMLAQEAASAARAVGAGVRLRRVARGSEARDAAWLGPWAAPALAEDIAWADAVLFGAPVRLGALAAPLLEFVQSLEPADGGRGPLWGKPAGGFAITPAPHAGAETALNDLGHVLLHTGAVLVPPGYTDPVIAAAGGNPYGTTHSRTMGYLPTPQAMAAAAHQSRRTVLAGDLLRRAPRPPGAATAPSGPAGPPTFIGSTA
ncbi:flavodoxin family protein [Streptomyces sp. NPDC087212]|uniref:flavodoxin family protein n=1 Tax=Streptomyces sp. NPDC087212 TaxID=3365766 RepID=UPI00381056C9